MKTKRIILVFVASLLSISHLWALDLEEAKEKGLVGETTSGYLAVVKPSTDTNSFTQEINAKRREAYLQIARKNGSPLEAVEEIGGKQAVQKASPGTHVKLPTGQWKKK